MKKSLFIILGFILIMVMVACNKPTTTEEDPTYSITFMDHDNSVLQIDNYKEGDSLSEIDFPEVSAISGLVFNGWVDPLPTTMPDHDIVLRQSWERQLNLSTEFTPIFNIHNESSEILDLLTATLYVGDYHWEKAIEEGLASERGDFTSGASAIPYSQFPSMASQDPIDVSGDGLNWDIYIRDDLSFRDGTMINAATFEYSWKMLLDPALQNGFAWILYSDSQLSIQGAQDYVNQDPNGSSLVPWSSVGIKADQEDQFLLHLTFDRPLTSWEIMSRLSHTSTSVVNPYLYNQALTEQNDDTFSAENIDTLFYGPYVLSDQTTEQQLFLEWNEDFIQSDDYDIRYIKYDVITDNEVLLRNFQNGELDLLPLTAESFYTFKEHPNLVQSLKTNSFQLSFNIEGNQNSEVNPLLIFPEFRQAIYFAIDRDTYANDVGSLGYPAQSFLLPSYLATEFNELSYRASDFGQNVLANFSPSTFGYDQEKAKELFDIAYAKAVENGYISDGDVVTLEYKYYDVEMGWSTENWFKDQLEGALNLGESSPKFSLILQGLSGTALNTAYENGDFEMVFTGWSGLKYNAPDFLGTVYNSEKDYMIGVGFDSTAMMIELQIPNTMHAINNWVNAYENKTNPTDDETSKYQAWVNILTRFNDQTGELICSYSELYEFLQYEFYNEHDYHYEGVEDDFNQITAKMEEALLTEMVAIPLVGSTDNSSVHSDNVILLQNEYNARMSWFDLRYWEMAPIDFSLVESE